MRFVLFTPRKRLPFVIFSHLLILSQPIFSFCIYTWNLFHDAYPIDGDSIGIPIGLEFIEWLLWMPVVLITVRKTVLKNYPGAISLGVWNREKQLWSVLWTLLFGMLLVIPFGNIPYDVKLRNPFELLNTCLWTLLYLYLRALIVARPDLVTGESSLRPSC